MTRHPTTPPPSSPAASRTMQANRGKDTRPELKLRRLLREAGYPGYRVHWGKAVGHPDVAYPGRKVAVFVNGCFWHRCPLCDPPVPKANNEFWTAKFAANVARDAATSAALEASGWKVVVVWECQLTQDCEAALDTVIRALEPDGGESGVGP